MDGIYAVEDMVITIRPEPKLDGEEAGGERRNELKPVRRQRSLQPTKKKMEDDIDAPLPLKWVLTGQQELREGTFNEVWVVFDNDNHPAKAQAFRQAGELINGVKVRIAYSSIAFEYYLLLHFERVYKDFQTSECREQKKAIHCSSGEHQNDCQGARCIGGYARSHGYWDNSKTNNSVFPLIEARLRTGFWNATWLRQESHRRAGDIIFYDRNPFVTTDDLVKRLTGFGDHHFEVVDVDQESALGDKLSIRFLPGRLLQISNTGEIGLVIPAGSVTRLSTTDGVIERVGERKVVRSGEVSELSYGPGDAGVDASRYSFDFDSWHVLLNE